jgi:hypothetical protein
MVRGAPEARLRRAEDASVETITHRTKPTRTRRRQRRDPARHAPKRLRQLCV